MCEFTTYVVVRTAFTAFHNWEAAPEETAFLRQYHRHVFHVTVKAPAEHDDRSIEFFELKARLDAFLLAEYSGCYLRNISCEMLCKMILEHFKELAVVCVFEDGENGAEVHRSYRE